MKFPSIIGEIVEKCILVSGNSCKSSIFNCSTKLMAPKIAPWKRRLAVIFEKNVEIATASWVKIHIILQLGPFWRKKCPQSFSKICLKRKSISTGFKESRITLLWSQATFIVFKLKEVFNMAALITIINKVGSSPQIFGFKYFSYSTSCIYL